VRNGDTDFIDHHLLTPLLEGIVMDDDEEPIFSSIKKHKSDVE
jgi:hypothetical protein